MVSNTNYTLVNPKTGNLAFKIYPLNGDQPFDHIQRLNYYSLIWIQEGSGRLKADFSEYEFSENTLLAFSPYQPFMLTTNTEIKAVVIHFHPDFFCIHKHHKEVSCHGVLFNNIYESPMVEIDASAQSTFAMIIEQLKDEMNKSALAQYEILISYLKIFLITASRLKKEQQDEGSQENTSSDNEPFILQTLKNYIETHYRSIHSANEYASMLAITPKALTKLTKTHFNKTLTDLISERIIIEAKRELYLTNKTVKEIAYELGYNDEYYFSRFFKKNAEVSPQLFRETVGFDRAGMG